MEKARFMARLYHRVCNAYAAFRDNVVARSAAEKFFGAWFSCILVMSRGSFLTAFGFEHVRIASVCGAVSAAIAVALMIQMNRNGDGISRQATVSAISTFIGDIAARQSQFSPQWIEPAITATISAGIAIAFWQARRFVKGFERRTHERQSTKLKA
jgi:hypothetical protein